MNFHTKVLALKNIWFLFLYQHYHTSRWIMCPRYSVYIFYLLPLYGK